VGELVIFFIVKTKKRIDPKVFVFHSPPTIAAISKQKQSIYMCLSFLFICLLGEWVGECCESVLYCVCVCAMEPHILFVFLRHSGRNAPQLSV